MEGTVGRCFATSTPDWGRDAGRGIGSLLIQPRSVYGYARILIELAGHSETIENTKHSIRIRLKGQLAWLKASSNALHLRRLDGLRSSAGRAETIRTLFLMLLITI